MNLSKIIKNTHIFSQNVIKNSILLLKSSKYRNLVLIAFIVSSSCSKKPAEIFIDTSKSRIEKIQFMDLQGKKFTLSEFKGKAIFLNFWASWCGPCIQEMESIMALKDQFKDSLIFLAASAEDQTQIEKFISKHNINLNFVRLTGSYLDAYIISLPTTLLIDRHSNLLEEVEGYRDWTDEANVQKIKRLIKY